MRIPKPYAVDLGLEPDTTVELAVDDGCLVIRPVAAARYELKELLANVSEHNLHPEQDFG